MCRSAREEKDEEIQLIYGLLCPKCTELADKDTDDDAIFNVERYCPECQATLKQVEKKLDEEDEIES